MATFGQEMSSFPAQINPSAQPEPSQIRSNLQGDANTVMDINVITPDLTLEGNNETTNNMMTISTPPHLLSTALGVGPDEEENRSPRKHYNHRNPSAVQREREERVRRIRELHEEERKKKLEELKQHVAHQQKFREQQDFERQKRMTEVRARDSDKHSQVEERRRAIESAERERRESLLRKNQEREDKIIEKRRAQQNQNSFAFGSSTPRMGYGTSKSDSTTDVCRSTSSHNMTLMTQSMYQTSNSQRRSTDREDPPAGMSKGTKRATSVHGLDQSTEEGEEKLMTQSYHPSGSSTAHRRRTDLMPTITLSSASPAAPSSGLSRSSTPGNKMPRSPGKAVSMSRLDMLSKPRLRLHATPSNSAPKTRQTPKTASPPNQKKKMSQSMSHLAILSASGSSPNGKRMVLKTSTKGRSPSAASETTGSGAVRMRNTPSGPRRPRPSSIATTGLMTTSMYEKRTYSGSNAGTPTRATNSIGLDKSKTPDSRPKRTKSVASDKDDETKSNSSSTSVTKVRRTPAQVKAESAARKAKAMKSPTPTKQAAAPVTTIVTSPTKSQSDSEVNDEPMAEQTEVMVEAEATEIPKREATPDVIRKSPVKEVTPAPTSSTTSSENGEATTAVNTPAKKIISSEEEAKVRLAEKRREMKEKKELEAEAERQRQAEVERLEAERQAKEEEEERKAMEEADRLAAVARKLEEERLEKAIEEAKKREEEEKKRKAEEEQVKKDREEAERKSCEEAERKQAELDEKIKRDEEDRLARKKRLEEIMARTRGGKGNNSANSTPKKEAPAAEDANEAKNGDKTNGEYSSLDSVPAGDPTRPDLLGDIAHVNNGGRQQPQSVSTDGLEKGVVDMNISENLMNAKNEAPLLEFDSLKHQPLVEALQDEPEFDQIFDLSSSSGNNGTEAGNNNQPPATPLIAFEDSITTSQKQEVPTADLLS